MVSFLGRTDVRGVRYRVTDKQTDRPNYCNPRCACAPRVNYGAKHQTFFALRAILYTRACARGRRPAPAPAPCTHVHTIACYGVVQCLPVKSPTIYRRNLRREKNDRLVSCTPPSTVERFGEKISAEAC